MNESGPRTDAGRALLVLAAYDGIALVAADTLCDRILAIESEAHEQGMLRQLERQIADECVGHKPIMLGAAARDIETGAGDAPHEHQWTAGTGPSIGHGIPQSVCADPNCPSLRRQRRFDR